VTEAVEPDLTDPDLYAAGDPHGIFARLREEPGLRWHPERDGPGFWAAVRYADCATVYRDTSSYTTRRGTLLGPDRGGPDPAAGKMLVMTDPPRHTKLRHVLNRGFTPAVVERLRARLEAEVDGLLDAALQAGRCDFLMDVAAPIPVAMMCAIMGVPPEDRDGMHRLTRVAFGSADPTYQLSDSERMSKGSAHSQLLAYYQTLLQARRLSPGDDLVSTLATLEVDGRRLSDQEIVLHCDNLVVGGNETTRHAAAGGLLALMDHPRELDRLRADPGLLEPAVEEILRWTSPAIHILRTARRSMVLGGQAILAGQQVVVWNVSANRDPHAFTDPDRFAVDRADNRHLSLGLGEHFCIGASLARMELRVLFQRLLARVARMEPAGAAERLRSNVIAGFTRLPVTLTGR
jgi:cytochrome P450